MNQHSRVVNMDPTSKSSVTVLVTSCNVLCCNVPSRSLRTNCAHMVSRDYNLGMRAHRLPSVCAFIAPPNHANRDDIVNYIFIRVRAHKVDCLTHKFSATLNNKRTLKVILHALQKGINTTSATFTCQRVRALQQQGDLAAHANKKRGRSKEGEHFGRSTVRVSTPLKRRLQFCANVEKTLLQRAEQRHYSTSYELFHDTIPEKNWTSLLDRHQKRPRQ